MLTSLGGIYAKFTAAQAALLRRFDVTDAHDSDGYGTASAWLAAKAQMSSKDARAAAGLMRRLGAHRTAPSPMPWPPGRSPAATG